MCKFKPEKEGKKRTRLTLGNISAPTESVTTATCVFNSVVSTPGERCLLANIKTFYLKNILPDPEFMRTPLKIIPQGIIDAYNLATLVDNQEYTYMHIKKGVYVIKQDSIIDNQELVKYMDPFGYHPIQHTPGLWVHDNQNTIFRFLVDDFVFSIPQWRVPTIFKMKTEQNIPLQFIWK